ncbi:PAS domain-containing protein [Ruminococcus sp. 210702-SL.1.03]|uniref:PAS domain-containing protein n=1 Tax=Ruminococcus sp. 210702-SL.1.03 TaxID=2883233 RepID=UPI001D061B30|nr:PAS domain-containing protein [Ruminococcus sp. 210702-SL.1.03]MCB6615300.1 PAS domain-containing protein [Ruminococcus sp. 210702-SL.1.03]
MDNNYFKSVIDADEAPVVICDLSHTVVYMNPTAVKRYEKRGGAALIGRSLMGCHNADSNSKIERVIAWFKKDPANNKVYTFRNEKENKDVYMIALRNDGGELIGYYEKHEYRNIESMALYDID